MNADDENLHTYTQKKSAIYEHLEQQQQLSHTHNLLSSGRGRVVTKLEEELVAQEQKIGIGDKIEKYSRDGKQRKV